MNRYPISVCDQLWLPMEKVDETLSSECSHKLQAVSEKAVWVLQLSQKYSFIAILIIFVVLA